MKLFLTGGTGFVGGYVLREAARQSWQVVASRRTPGATSEDSAAEVIWLNKPLDGLEAEDFSGVDVLLHLASPGVSPKQATWDELFYWNVTILLKLLRTAHEAGVRRFVLAGSFAEYGRAGERYEFIPPDAPLEPITAYAGSKAAGFVAAHAYCVQHSLELCYQRIFSAFGEGQHSANFWPALKEAALSGRDFSMTPGEQVRDFVAVEEVARKAVEACGRRDVVAGRPAVENVGSGIPCTLRAFAETWWEKWNASGRLLIGAVPYRPNEVMRFVPEITPPTSA